MIPSNEIFEYYMSDKFKPILPNNTSFRHFRFKTFDKNWRKVKAKISNQEDLLKWIVKLGGCDIYYSTSQWANPGKISSKSGKNTKSMYHIADNLLLGNDLVFDIDAKEPLTMESLDLARKSTHNIFELMKNYKESFELEYLSFTGCKGFRLSYKPKDQELHNNPRKRIHKIEQNRKLFIDSILKQYKEVDKTRLYKVKPFFDEDVTINIMCVIRVIGTVHSTTGYISTKLPTSILKKKVDKILNQIPYIGKRRPVIPKREMISGSGDTSSSSLQILAKDVSGLASLPHIPMTHKYFTTNRVLGVRKGFIPVFIYQEQQQHYKKEMTKLQEKYQLGDLFVFNYEGQKVVISLKTMQPRQLQKVLNESTSRTKHDFRKFKRILIPYMIDFNEKIEGKFTGHLSKGHAIFVNPYIEHISFYYAGWDQIELIKAKREAQI